MKRKKKNCSGRSSDVKNHDEYYRQLLQNSSPNDEEISVKEQPQDGDVPSLQMSPSMPTKSYFCDMCDKGFSYPQTLKIHYQNLHNSGAEICWLCDKKCGCFSRLKKHLSLEHRIETPFKCNYCDQSFLLKRIKDAHVRKSHPHARPFVCNECGMSFRTIKTRHSHVTLCHKDTPRLKCIFCDYEGLRNTLGAHMRAIHLDIRPFECDICDSRFRDKTQLRYHVDARHKKLKDHKCDVCQKRFGFENSLKRHLKEVHGDERSFKCQLCYKTYKGRNGLKHHLKTFDHNSHLKLTFKKRKKHQQQRVDPSIQIKRLKDDFQAEIKIELEPSFGSEYKIEFEP